MPSFSLTFTILVFILSSTSARADWIFEEEKDPFTDQIQKTIAYESMGSSGSTWKIKAECFRSFGVGIELPFKTATADPKFSVKYRVDNNKYHTATWITPYSYGNYLAINKVDWRNILSEAKENSAITIGFSDYSDVIKFDMKGFRSAYDRVVMDCEKRNGGAGLY